ncbi:MAG TPA: response regulator [Verrucomicrobiae bacterium]|jgi:hypothetical protein|nr:response regulator [Verrucomicrobiae bacterium]
MSDPTPSARLFIVDDDEGLLRLAARALGRAGHAVQTAASGAEAMQWLSQNTPDLLLLDLKLQDAGAEAIISRLAKAGRLPPFLIITGQGDEQVAVEMMKGGARDYLVKTNDFLDALPTVVGRALKQLQQEAKLAAAEEALRLSEARFRVALKHSPVSVFSQDASLRYTWSHNTSVENAEQSIIGKTDEDLLPPEDAERLTQIKNRVLMTGAGIRQEVTLLIHGQKRTFDLTVEAVSDGDGRITGLTGAAMDITERKRLEDDVLRISELEQRRIGQDLHDGICQQLTGIELMSETLAQGLAKKSKAQAAQAEEIAAHVRDAIGQARSLARGLSPFILESEGLTSALRDLAASAEKMFHVQCVFSSEGEKTVPDLTVATHLYRIAQESVNNAIKHGRAKKITVQLSVTSDKTLLTVTDDGQGFAPSARSPGMGLRTMQYRAGLIGATLLTQSKPGGGARIVCFLIRPSP